MHLHRGQQGPSAAPFPGDRSGGLKNQAQSSDTHQQGLSIPPSSPGPAARWEWLPSAEVTAGALR